MARTKPRLNFWQIWNMSFGFLGIQFGFALQNGNVSRIFETLGANIDNIPIDGAFQGICRRHALHRAAHKRFCNTDIFQS